MMNKFTQFINKINEWRDKVMTEERKRDLQSVLQAGKKVVAKLKKYHDDKIISYDGADAFYSDAADYADNIDDAVERAFAGEEVFVEETDVDSVAEACAGPVGKNGGDYDAARCCSVTELGHCPLYDVRFNE